MLRMKSEYVLNVSWFKRATLLYFEIQLVNYIGAHCLNFNMFCN